MTVSRELKRRPGPRYDRALRGLSDPTTGGHEAMADLIGLTRARPVRSLSASFPATTRTADLLLRVGEHELAHVEYMRSGASDLVARMLTYRGLIMEAYPDHRLSQHVVVLGSGRVKGQETIGSGFQLELNVLYLRDLDPAPLLRNPRLAPLAVLARGDAAQRAQSLARAVRVIHAQGGDQWPTLFEWAVTLATIRLPATTIVGIVREAGMSTDSIADVFSDTEFGQALLGRGREEGREEGRAGLLTGMLRARFGDHPDLAAIAHTLAELPDADVLPAITAATRLEDLTR